MVPGTGWRDSAVANHELPDGKRRIEMTIQEMAQETLGLTRDDHNDLDEVTEVETATFEAYRSAYALAPRMICKGCHGG